MDINQIAIEMNREWKENCWCKSCQGRTGPGWYAIINPQLFHSLTPVLTTEQMVKQWEKQQERQKRRAPTTARTE